MEKSKKSGIRSVRSLLSDRVRDRKKSGAELVDSEGRSIPVKFIDKVLLSRHDLVECVLEQVLEHESILKALKRELFEVVQEHLDRTAEQYGENWQGNARLWNFDKSKQVEIAVKKQITFDERLNVAKSKIDSCMKRWSSNARKELQTLVMEAFKVDKKGNVDVKQILSLKNYQFDDAEWREAMDIISDALTVYGSKEYMNFAVRDKVDGKWQSISLNFSALSLGVDGANRRPDE
jgi:hypothetical protein